MNVIEQSDWAVFLRQATAGDALAQSYVGSTYAEGARRRDGSVLVRRNRAEAKKWLLKSAAQACASGQLALSDFLSDIDSDDCDFLAAIMWAKGALAQGEASAAHNLGCIYRDLRKARLAFRYFKLAVDMGSQDDWLACALCYLTGYGVPQDFDAADKALKRILATSENNVTQATRESASYWSAVINLLGLTRATRSVAKARTLLELANADDDHEQANELLRLIGRTPRSAQKKKPAWQAERAGGTS